MSREFVLLSLSIYFAYFAFVQSNSQFRDTDSNPPTLRPRNGFFGWWNPRRYNEPRTFRPRHLPRVASNPIGQPDARPKLRLLQPFYINLRVPKYPIKRGEVVAIPVDLFNDMPSSVVANVTLADDDEAFDLVDARSHTHHVHIKPNNKATTTFMVKPNKVGPLGINVRADTPLFDDDDDDTLFVDPEGEPHNENKPLFVDLRHRPHMHVRQPIEFPTDAFPDTRHIVMTVDGDLLGPTIRNLRRLIKMPIGCGEQNMMNFVPDVVVINYLTIINQLPPDVEDEALDFLGSGYHHELKFKHKDGSFSAFGIADSCGSTWLTAFVAKSFRQAVDDIYIDEDVIENALKWLAKQQAKDGSFNEVGHIVHSDLQGGGGHGLALTAYVSIAFLENQNAIPQYQDVTDKALNYLSKNLDDSDIYSLALVAYALQLANHEEKDSTLEKLMQKSINIDDQTWWQKKSSPTLTVGSKSNSIDIETTAYALLAMVEGGKAVEGLAVMRWLLGQRNEEGGFQSTQDTVVGLQALAKIALTIATETKNIKLTVNYGPDNSHQFNVNAHNTLQHQKLELPSSTKYIDINASGNGFALFQLSYQYFTNAVSSSHGFNVMPSAKTTSNGDKLDVTVCTSFIPNDNSQVSNMAIMEVNVPTGYTTDSENIPLLKASENVRMVEIENSGSKVIIYFDNLGTKQLCPTITAHRIYKVAMLASPSVKVYDYYDTSRYAQVSYTPPAVTLSDIDLEDIE